MYSNKSIIVLMSLFCAIAGLCPAEQTAPAQEQPDPFENTAVLVEAFIVKIANSALSEAGISPIGQSPENVTPMKILWCLRDETKAQVISGAKVLSRNKTRAVAETSEKINLKRESTTTTNKGGGSSISTDVRFEQYSSGTTFTILPTVRTQNLISLEFAYRESGIGENDNKTSPPDTFSRNWQSGLTARSGKPVIAGAMQSNDSTIFLILTAAVQNLDDVEE